MTSDQPVPESLPPPNVAALVDAIDARSRQAGADGATEAMQRLLGSVTDALAGIQDRLDQVEDSLTAGAGAGSSDLAEAVQAGLASFNARLGRLEEAFVQAVDESGSGTQAVVDEVRTVVSRALEDSGRDERRLVQEDVGAALSALGERIEGLERSLRARATEPIDPTAAVRAAVAPLLDRLEEAVDRLGRDEASARLVKLVEERMSAGLRAVTERTDEVRRAVEQMGKATASDGDVLADLVASVKELQSATRDVPEDVAAAIGARLEPLSDRLAGLDFRFDALTMSAAPAAPADSGVAVGRKAGEVTRRLAADFGIKPRRNGTGDRRGPRALGSG